MIITELRQIHKLADLLSFAHLPRSVHYYHLAQEKKEDKYSSIKKQIQEIYHANKGRYGYRRITLALKNLGLKINHKTVYRLMNCLGLVCRVRMKKYKSYRGSVGKIATNVIARDFKADKPNKKWATDVTEFSLFGKKLYLSPILDMYNGEIISYDVSSRPNFNQIITMLNKAFDKVKDTKGIILHSDQGWQYQTKQYQGILKDKEMIISMSRKGNCLDNAVIENFFGHVKSELLYLMEFTSIEQFELELISYLEYYNHSRISSKLKGLTPVQYRNQSLLAS